MLGESKNIYVTANQAPIPVLINGAVGKWVGKWLKPAQAKDMVLLGAIDRALNTKVYKVGELAGLDVTGTHYRPDGTDAGFCCGRKT